MTIRNLVTVFRQIITNCKSEITFEIIQLKILMKCKGIFKDNFWKDSDEQRLTLYEQNLSTNHI